MAMAIYATVIISFILMLVDIIVTYDILHQDDLLLNTHNSICRRFYSIK